MSETEKATTEKDSLVPEAPEPIILFVHYEASEVNNASWLVFREETGGKEVFTIFCLVFVFSVMFSLSYLGIFTKSPPPDGPHQTWIALALFLAIIFGPPITAIWRWRVLKADKLSTFTREPRYHLPTVYTVTTDGFQIAVDSTQVLTPWSKITACYELAESLTLVSSGAIFPLPKRCFASNQQLRNTRRLIIEKGVTYATVGSQKGEIVFTGSKAPAPSETLLLNEKTEILMNKQQAESAELDPTEEKEPSSQLSPPQTLTIECNYSIKELKEVDKKLFLKRDIASLALYYTELTLFGYCYCNFMADTMGEVGSWVRTSLLTCAPFAVPAFFIHARYLFEKRIEQIREFVKLDLPFFITLSSTDISVRSKRASISYPWTMVKNCIATKEHYICRGQNLTITIPKTALNERSKEIFVENLLRTKIKQYEEWN